MYFLKERIKRILTDLEVNIYQIRFPVNFFKMKEGDFKYGQIKFFETSDWTCFNTGDRWGGRNKYCWFITEISIPKEFQGKEVMFEVKTGRENGWDAINPQFLVYVNGKIAQAIDVNHREVILSDCAEAGRKYTIALKAFSGMEEGLVDLYCSICVLDRNVERLYYNIKVPLEVAELLETEDKRRIDIINYLNETINLLDFRKPCSQSFYESVTAANTFIENEFYSKYCGSEDVIVDAVGHTHIDVAWLWTLAQTREKAARSFSTVLNLMKQYPEYIFMSSQPQLYKFVKEDYPEIYEEIKKAVKGGSWEAEGAMWLEADCNLTSGESLVRQILFGSRFFKNEFGVENKILWLPDVFGYSAALPQILKKSGIDYFMTTKISWNEYNKLPYDSFMWRGLDGTEILTHFITTEDYNAVSNDHRTTYNGMINASQVMGTWRRYQQKDINNQVLLSFGYGDGGGGATKEMLENAKRLSKGIPGAPKLKMSKALDFFRNLEAKVSNNNKLPKWVGELYLEYHRGTYTTMAKNKKYNRRSEFLYQDIELLSVFNNLYGSKNTYPQKEINSGWEKVLLNQFHDIIPGSSIKEVYEDSHRQYEELIGRGKSLLQEAVHGIACKIDLKNLSVIVFNQLSFERSDIVEIDLQDSFGNIEIFDGDKLLESQIINEGKVIFYAENIPSKGYKAFTIKPAGNVSNIEAIKVSREIMENNFFTIRFNENMNIISIFDKKENREILRKGAVANLIQAFEDKPINFDAWDINLYYQEKSWEITDIEAVEIVERGPVRAGVKIRRRFLDSYITQIIYIYKNIPRIDFKSTIDWKEKQILLKAAFPVEINSNKATYEIQYGNVERPTHWNTSWDFARFEVCAHKWADFSEGDYGVSLMNDCKYGYDIKDGVMRLTLLKSAVDPNVDADRYVHEFSYSIYPHEGDWKKAKTVQMAYSFNNPMYCIVEKEHQGSLPTEFSLLRADKTNVMIDVVKKAEDSDHIIVRMYEFENKRSQVKLNFNGDLKEAWECDLMENNLRELTIEHNCVKFEIKPYEIKTFMLKTK